MLKTVCLSIVQQQTPESEIIKNSLLHVIKKNTSIDLVLLQCRPWVLQLHMHCMNVKIPYCMQFTCANHINRNA